MVHCVNIRAIKIHGFFSIELILGFNPIYISGADVFENQLKLQRIKVYTVNIVNEEIFKEKANYKIRIAIINEIKIKALKLKIMK